MAFRIYLGIIGETT